MSIINTLTRDEFRALSMNEQMDYINKCAITFCNGYGDYLYKEDGKYYDVDAGEEVKDLYEYAVEVFGFIGNLDKIFKD